MMRIFCGVYALVELACFVAAMANDFYWLAAFAFAASIVCSYASIDEWGA